MTDKLVKAFKQQIDEMILLPSDGGRFEIKVDDELIYSKLATGSFPDEGDIEKEIRQRV